MRQVFPLSRLLLPSTRLHVRGSIASLSTLTATSSSPATNPVTLLNHITPPSSTLPTTTQTPLPPLPPRRKKKKKLKKFTKQDILEILTKSIQKETIPLSQRTRSIIFYGAKSKLFEFNLSYFTNVLLICVQNKKALASLRLLAYIEKYHSYLKLPDIFYENILYAISLHETSFKNRSQHVLKLIEKIRKLSPHGHLKFRTYNLILGALDPKDANNALQFFNEIKSRKYEPNVLSYNFLMTRLLHGGNDEQKKLILPLSTELDQNRLTINYNTSLQSRVEAKDLYNFYLIDNQMKQNVVARNAKTYILLLQGNYLAEKYNSKTKQDAYVESIELLEEMKSKGIEITLDHYNICLATCVHAGAHSKALQIFNQIPHPTHESYSQIITSCAQKGDIPQGILFSKKIDSLDIKNYNNLIKLYTNSNTIEETKGFEIYKEIKTQEKTNQKLKPTQQTYIELLQLCLKTRDYIQAKYYLQQLKQEKLIRIGDTHIYELVFRVFSECYDSHEKVRAHLYKESITLMDEMHMLALKPTLTTYNTYINILGKYGDTESIIELLNDMKKDYFYSMDESTNFHFLHSLSLNNKQEEIKNLLEYIKLDEKKKKNKTKLEYLPKYVVQNIVKEEDTKITYPQEKASITIYNEWLDIYAEHSNIKNISALSKEVLEIGLTPDIKTYNKILKAYNKTQDAKHSLKIWNDIKQNKDISPTKETYDIILRTLRSSGEESQREEIQKEWEQFVTRP